MAVVSHVGLESGNVTDGLYFVLNFRLDMINNFKDSLIFGLRMPVYAHFYR